MVGNYRESDILGGINAGLTDLLATRIIASGLRVSSTLDCGVIKRTGAATSTDLALPRLMVK